MFLLSSMICMHFFGHYAPYCEIFIKVFNIQMMKKEVFCCFGYDVNVEIISQRSISTKSVFQVIYCL